MWVTRCPYGAIRASHIACVYGGISIYQSIYLSIWIYVYISVSIPINAYVILLYLALHKE